MMRDFHFYTAGQGKADISTLMTMSNQVLPSVHGKVKLLYDKLNCNLRRLLCIIDDDTIVLPIAGTGTLAMEILISNIIGNNEKVMVARNGFFAARLADIIQRAGGEPAYIDRSWGEAVTLEDVQELSMKSGAKILYMIHGETSTGVLQPIEKIAYFCNRNDILLLLDCATTIGGAAMKMTEWKVNGLFTISQKCIGASPGLSVIAVDKKYLNKMGLCHKSNLGFYMDLQLLINDWLPPNKYHHTQPYSLINSLNTAIECILEEGQEIIWSRYANNALYVVKALELLGMELIIKDSNIRLPQLITVKLPKEVSCSDFIENMKNRYHIYLSKGLGQLGDNIVRVGLMSKNADKTEIVYLLSCLLLYMSSVIRIDTKQYIELLNDFCDNYI